MSSDRDYRVMRIHDLELPDGFHKNYFDHMRAFHKWIYTSYNKKVHPREFHIGDLVLIENLKNHRNKE